MTNKSQISKSDVLDYTGDLLEELVAIVRRYDLQDLERFLSIAGEEVSRQKQAQKTGQTPPAIFRGGTS